MNPSRATRCAGGTWRPTAPSRAAGTIGSVPLAARADMLKRGPNAGLVPVTSVTELQAFRWRASGLVRDARLNLGEGSEQTVADVAIEP